MRELIFRIVAAVLAGLTAWAFVVMVGRGIDFALMDGNLYAALGMLVLGPSFAVYAVLGEDAASRLLVRLGAPLGLPEALAERLLRHVELPEELRDDDDRPPELG